MSQEKIKISATYNNILFATCKEINIIQSFGDNNDKVEVCGTIVFKKFINSYMAAPLQNLTVTIDCDQYKLILENVCVSNTNNTSINIFRSNRLYNFKASIFKMITNLGGN